MTKETENVAFGFKRFKKQQRWKKPKLDMKTISRIPKMSEKELDELIEKESKKQGWKDA